jgi:hypothetical protein
MSNYIASERFIHDALEQRAEQGLEGLYRAWKKRKKITPFIIAWPADVIHTESGAPIDGPCLLELPEDKNKWRSLILETVRFTNAYGIVFVSQRENDVQAIFETRHGAKCWTMPIVRSGDVDILQAPIVTVNKEHLGLLWQKKEGLN